MTMHLLPPMYSTTGKKKGRVKFASSEQKKQAEQLAKEWEQLKRTYAPTPKSQPRVMPKRSFSISIPKNRSTDHIPSRSSGIGNAVKADIPVYTGTKMLGIGVLHKSNAVPVFSDEEAIDISKMRRG